MECNNLSKIYIPKSVKKIGKDFIDSVKNGIKITYAGNSKDWINLTNDKTVVISSPTLNDYHYYGDSTDKIVPTIIENEIIISKNIKYTVFCEEDNIVISNL